MNAKEKKLVAFFGDPASHSKSPIMHNGAYSNLGLDFEYIAIRVPKGEISKAIDRIRKGEFIGANISMPHKEEVMEFLDEIHPLAKSCGAINTVVNRDGKLIGYNTDVLGLAKSLKESTSIENKKALILGAGGAAKAAITALTMEGIGEITVVSRKEMGTVLNQALPSDIDILINATPVGMGEYEGESLIPDSSYLHKDLFVMDLIYEPHETKLLNQAKEAGCRGYKNGLDMLLYQGAESFKLFTGMDAPIEVMRDAIKRK